LPGRSNALAIATRLGLDANIIADARQMVATEDLVADDLLDEIHRTREDIRRQQASIAATREDVEAERADLQVKLSEVEDERRNIVSAARRNVQGEMDQFRRELRKLRNQLRDASLPLDKLREVRERADNLAGTLNDPVADALDMPDALDWTPRLGDAVWLDTLKAEGTITELDKSDAMVQIGTLRVRTNLAELRKPTRGERKASKKRRGADYTPEQATPAPSGQSPGLELDLRGARVEAAIRRLEDYIDAAYLAGLPFARVIHGKGTGALRKAVKERVDEHPLISKAIMALPKEGGDGVTVIYLVPLT
jgi:DNA mismatch repair protein MutS2